MAPVEAELEAMDAKQLKAMLREIYAAHNPERLEAVDDLCAEYAGNEAVLLAAVREKYGIDSVPQQRFSLEVPRVTAKQLAERPDLLAGTVPFVLLGEANRWPAAQRWAALERLAAMIPSETVDFYPSNYNSTFGKLNRTLMAMPEAVRAFRGPATRLHREDWEDARYMQIRLTSEGWDALRHDLLPLPQSFWTEAEWIRKCMTRSDGAVDESAISSWLVVNQWNFLLIGSAGAGMYFHNDHLAAASWQASVVGRKRWILCRNADSHIFSGVEGMTPSARVLPIDAFSPDYSRFPGASLWNGLACERLYFTRKKMSLMMCAHRVRRCSMRGCCGIAPEA